MTDPTLDQFAPGPWTWEYFGRDIAILDVRRMVIARLTVREDASEQVAHARLIVKSRELFRWLRSVHLVGYKSHKAGRETVEELLSDVAGVIGQEVE